jgi:hypothetical protein
MLPTVGSGFLRLSDFQKLLEENQWIAEIELSNYGEIFLNPDLLVSNKVKTSAFRRIDLSLDIC